MADVPGTQRALGEAAALVNPVSVRVLLVVTTQVRQGHISPANPYVSAETFNPESFMRIAPASPRVASTLEDGLHEIDRFQTTARRLCVRRARQ